MSPFPFRCRRLSLPSLGQSGQDLTHFGEVLTELLTAKSTLLTTTTPSSRSSPGPLFWIPSLSPKSGGTGAAPEAKLSGKGWQRRELVCRTSEDALVEADLSQIAQFLLNKIIIIIIIPSSPPPPPSRPVRFSSSRGFLSFYLALAPFPVPESRQGRPWARRGDLKRRL